MRKKFDVPNAAATRLQIETGPSRACHRTAEHRGHVVKHREIECASPNKGLQVGQKGGAHLDIASHWARANKGRPFPCARDGFVITDCRLALNADSSGAGVRSQAQIHPPANAVTRGSGQQADKTACQIDKKGLAGLGFCQRVIVSIMKNDQIDVG